MAIGEGVDPRLSGRPGDQLPPHARETFNLGQAGQYMDTAAGKMLQLQFGGRTQAMNSFMEGQQADLAWRRVQAAQLLETYPNKYATVADAMHDVHAPAGGGGAYLTGSADEIVAGLKRIDPLTPARVLGGEEKDNSVKFVGVQTPGGMKQADPRAPWQRG
jgi:hypothetical protein